MTNPASGSAASASTPSDVLIRDVAYGCSPRRSAAVARRGRGFIIRGPCRDRIEALRLPGREPTAARRSARRGFDVPGARRLRSEAWSCWMRRYAAAALCSTRGLLCAIRRAVSPGRPLRPRRRGSERSRATWRAFGPGGRRLRFWIRSLEYHRSAETWRGRRPHADRTGLWPRRSPCLDANYQRASTCSRRAAVHRAGAPLRGGGVAYMHTATTGARSTPGEVAAPAERLDELVPPAAPRHLRVFRRSALEGPRELERRRARARVRPRRGVRALLTLGSTLSLRDPTTTGRRGYREALERPRGRRPSLAGRAACLAGAARHSQCGLGRGRERDRGQRLVGRTRGPARQALLPLRDARCAGLARGQLGGGDPLLPPRP